MSFQAGDFERASVARLLRRFCPVRAVSSIHDIDFALLAQQGKKAIFLDVDNTLVVWKQDHIPEATREWVRRLHEAGLEAVLISNTKRPIRLKRLSEELGLRYVRGMFKPSKDMYRKALNLLGIRPNEAVMVGDQVFTDVWGANRVGIDAIWVKQMEDQDFIGTKVSRFGESLLKPYLYRAMKDAPKAPETEGLLQNPTVRQFVKFVIIGATSTVIDIGLLTYMMWWFQGGAFAQSFGQQLIGWNPGLFEPIATTMPGKVEPAFAAQVVMKPFTAGLAILNSFIWNRYWTFGVRGKEGRFVQMQKFFAVAIIGMLLNTVIVGSLSNVIPGHPKRSALVANLIGMVIVAFWNFFGQKLWTFKKK